ncbi:hypothetical protein F5B19DRAFT_476179 [Rostrohypoxylon terebratum]|nr:hypothetical protein F5B19DRAFT_476179 [Rostrohypoxylon terebratum]
MGRRYLNNLIGLLLVWLRLCHISPSNAQDLETILTDPGNNWAPTTTVTFPGTQEFIDATLRWEVYAPPSYSAAISPGTEADVVKSVKLAITHNIPLLATGARHGYTTTLARLRNGLAIDLSQFDSIKVDEQDETVTVGGAVKMRQVFDPVYDAGFELQTGGSQCPGLIGATLGGGIGRDLGRYGLVLDALLSVRLVTADARLIDVSATSHPDLFWAIRGAGANFGIIISATYKLHSISNDNYGGHATSFDINIPLDMSATYFKTLADSYSGGLPAKVESQAIVIYDPTTGGPSLLANWVYFGPEAEARKAIAPIFGLGLTNITTTVVPWSKLSATIFYGVDASTCSGNRSVDMYGVTMRAISAPTYQAAVEKMTKLYAENAEARESMLTFEFLPNEAALSVPDDATAYPWRDAIAYLLISLAGMGEAGEGFGRQMRGEFAATSGYPGLSVYVNYAHGDESPEQVFGSRKLPKLTALKKIWDPNNVFRFSNPLPV